MKKSSKFSPLFVAFSVVLAFAPQAAHAPINAGFSSPTAKGAAQFIETHVQSLARSSDSKVIRQRSSA